MSTLTRRTNIHRTIGIVLVVGLAVVLSAASNGQFGVDPRSNPAGDTITLSPAALTVAASSADGLAAGDLNDATFGCDESGSVQFGLPLYGPARMSTFVYRIDGVGGPVGQTEWFYSDHGTYWIYGQYGWERLTDGSHRSLYVGAGHTVEGYEYRWYPEAQWGDFFPITACSTQSMINSPYYFPYSH